MSVHLKDFSQVSEIGRGTYSTVFKATRISNSQTVAVKAVTEPAVAELEISLLKRIKSPYVVALLDVFTCPSHQVCLVQEYADLGDFSQSLNRLKSSGDHLREADWWAVFNGAGRGLAAIHSAAVVHRDVKCANVFLFSVPGRRTLGNVDQPTFIAKIGDLNVSRLLPSTNFASTQTGTPYYAAPEIWSQEPYDRRCDAWSFGCLLYEAASLSPPFLAETAKELHAKVRVGKVEHLCGYSEGVNRIVERLLVVDPGARPTVAEVVAEETERMCSVSAPREDSVDPEDTRRLQPTAQDKLHTLKKKLTSEAELRTRHVFSGLSEGATLSACSKRIVERPVSASSTRCGSSRPGSVGSARSVGTLFESDSAAAEIFASPIKIKKKVPFVGVVSTATKKTIKNHKSVGCSPSLYERLVEAVRIDKD